MASRIRIFSKTGLLIYEVSAPAYREWVLNDIGTANFTIRAQGMQKYVEFGNYITIENSKLDTWVGVITTPRSWNSNAITINAKSAVWLFNNRVGNYEQPVSGSWGEVLTQMIEIANNAESTLMQMGTYAEGISYSSVVDMSNIYTYLQRALAQSQTRLDFRPVITNGQLNIFIDMQASLYTASNLRLEEGLNIKKNSPLLIEQGEIYNDITILGVGLDQSKYTAHAEDPASIALYGRRQKLFSEGQSQNDVNRLAVVRLSQYAYPRNTFALTAMDKGDTFLYTRVGAKAAVKLNTVGYLNNGLGFDGTAYIRAIQFNDKNKEAVLICQEN